MKNIFGTLAICVLLLIVLIKIAPVLSDLQTVSRGNKIVDTAKKGDIEKATEEWSGLVVDISIGAIWSSALAPILAFVIALLTALFLYLKRR